MPFEMWHAVNNPEDLVPVLSKRIALRASYGINFWLYSKETQISGGHSRNWMLPLLFWWLRWYKDYEFPVVRPP